MIKKHVREVAEKRGIKNAFGLQKKLEISPTVATKLWNGDFEMIGLGTLDKLCKALKTHPGKLLTFEDDE